MSEIDRRLEKIERKLEDVKGRRLVVLFGDDPEPAIPDGEPRPCIIRFDEQDRNV